MDEESKTEVNDAIEAAIAEFKGGLRRHIRPMGIVREFITHGQCMMINQEKYAILRERVAAELSVHPNRDVYIVGSAKLGFSIKPARRYGYFGEESDVDVAVVSSELYFRLWKEARAFIASKELWSASKAELFREQHLHGRISPKNLHKASPLIPTAMKLWEIGRVLQRERVAGPYPVTFAVWVDMDTLEDYQAKTVEQCQEIEAS